MAIDRIEQLLIDQKGCQQNRIAINRTEKLSIEQKSIEQKSYRQKKMAIDKIERPQSKIAIDRGEQL